MGLRTPGVKFGPIEGKTLYIFAPPILKQQSELTPGGAQTLGLQIIR
jgi:hypothetical protein